MRKKLIAVVIALALLLVLGVSVYAITDGAYLGEIGMFAFDFTPSRFARVDGATYNTSFNTMLFSLLGTRFGGNGVTTFGLPNLTPYTPYGGEYLHYDIATSGLYPQYEGGAQEHHVTGEIKLFPYERLAGSTWIRCNGAALPAASSPMLVACIGNRFGSDSAGMFNVPDLRAVEPEGMYYYICAEDGNGFFTMGEMKLLAGSETFYNDRYSGSLSPCRGQSMLIINHMALYSLIGSNYGGDGTTTFALPTTSGTYGTANNLLNPLPGLEYYIVTLGSYPSRS